MAFDPSVTNAALARMRDAQAAGRGVRLSKDELDAFSVELLGQWWAAIDETGRNVESEGYTDAPKQASDKEQG